MRISDEQMTLGQLIDALTRINEPDLPVRFDWCSLSPNQFQSYRGYYEDLALGITCERRSVSVQEVLEWCQGALTETFQGYKGGDYRMNRNTPIWVANYGRATGWALVGVDLGEFQVTLKTREID